MNAQQKSSEVREHPGASNEDPGQEASVKEGTHTPTKVKPCAVSVDAVVTSVEAFGRFPVHGNSPLFMVAEGMPVLAALEHSACIVDGLRELMNEAVLDGGLSASKSWLAEEALDRVFALLASATTSMERAKVVA